MIQPGPAGTRSTITGACSSTPSRCARGREVAAVPAAGRPRHPTSSARGALLAAWDGDARARTARRRRFTPTWRSASSVAGARRRASGRRRDSRSTRRASTSAIARAHEEPGRGLVGVAMGPDAHARVSASVRRAASICRRSSVLAAPGTVAADGASYREILDVADWDRSIVTNVPGPVRRSPAARSTAICSRSGPRTRTSRSFTRGRESSENRRRN